MEKRQLEVEVERMKNSQEKLKRALATEKKVHRRASTGSFVLRDQNNIILVSRGSMRRGGSRQGRDRSGTPIAENQYEFLHHEDDVSEVSSVLTFGTRGSSRV
jgi:hypothetical protein